MMPNENQSHTILKQFKRLSTQTIIYGLGDAIIKAITFFLIPLYTRVLTQEEVGIIALINLIELILVLILSLSFNSAVLKVFFDYETEREKRAVFSTSLIFILLCALCFLTVVFFNTDVLSRLVFKTDKYAFYLKFVLGSVFFSLFRLFGLAYLRALEKPVHYSILNIIGGMHFSYITTIYSIHFKYLLELGFYIL
jgi:O-antigen/teichoic acid export membrane protein